MENDLVIKRDLQDMTIEEMKEFADAEGFKVGYVDFWETPKSHCHYEP